MNSKRIGRYGVLRELGSGSMATVYLGQDPFIKRQVAIKVMSPEYTADPTFEDRFRLEAQIIATLDHSAIVPVYDFGFHGEQLFIVMPFMAGGSLADRLAEGPLAGKDILAVLDRIGSALDDMHGKGIIHRDIKPANILLNERGDAYLSDFGIAKNLAQPSGFTATDVILGTVDYMSPEQINSSKNLDGRTDVYAMGIVLFYMLTGALPYKRDTIVGTAMAHLGDPIPSVLTQIPTLESGWDAIFVKALAKNRDERYGTVGEMAQAVRALIK
ncbi:MAG: serine/threonine protein kinase [Anaerolineales bacterium]|nr:serine/threonine protein kinase [Anaerolineales bacterium]MCA9931974.1 serine/threonine protein kinase [Anaerolineales bacterium]